MRRTRTMCAKKKAAAAIRTAIREPSTSVNVTPSRTSGRILYGLAGWQAAVAGWAGAGWQSHWSPGLLEEAATIVVIVMIMMMVVVKKVMEKCYRSGGGGIRRWNRE